MNGQAVTRLEVRLAVPADETAIVALVARAYPEMGTYSAGMVRGHINNFPEGQFVAVFEYRSPTAQQVGKGPSFTPICRLFHPIYAPRIHIRSAPRQPSGARIFRHRFLTISGLVSGLWDG